MKLSERAMLVTLNIAVWHAEREDKTRAEEISAKYGSDPRMGKYRRFLIDPDVLKPITKKRGEMRNRHYELTLPWGDDSSRIITSAGFFRYRDEMDRYQRELEELFREFIDAYPDHVANARQLLNGLYRPEEYPSPSMIRSYFRAGFRFRPVPDAGDFRVNLGKDEIDTIRKQIEADTQSAVNDAMGETVKRIRDTVGHMAQKLREYSVTDQGVKNPFRDSLVGNVRDLVDILPGLNIAGDRNIDRVISEIKAELTKHDADTLRVDDGTRVKVAQAADDILKRMEEYGL